MKLHQIPRQMKNFFIFYFFGRKYIMSKFILLRTIYDSINKKKKLQVLSTFHCFDNFISNSYRDIAINIRAVLLSITML